MVIQIVLEQHQLPHHLLVKSGDPPQLVISSFLRNSNGDCLLNLGGGSGLRCLRSSFDFSATSAGARTWSAGSKNGLVDANVWGTELFCSAAAAW